MKASLSNSGSSSQSRSSLSAFASRTSGMLDWEISNLPEAPSSPENMKEAGLNMALLNDMILRMLLTRGTLLGLELARALCMPFKVLEESLNFLKQQHCVEVGGGDLIGQVSYRFNLTDLGRERAAAAFRSCSYVGPCPVPLEDYVEQTYRQAVTGIHCQPEALRGCFSHLVVPEELFMAIGPAVVSGRSIFLFGPPGNGKTAIANSIGDFMNRCGGEIYVPYAFQSEGNVVTVFDPTVHQMVEDRGDERLDDNEATIRRLLNTNAVDARWVRVRRPVIVTGGELQLNMLDLRYSAEANFYQAPLHLKANGGVFLIDDFGRQMVSPRELLNRWIVPLENRHDYLTLASGKKIEIPFEQLIIFSTNLDPKDLVDDAFARRIRHKVGINAPNRDTYEKIFNANCKRLGMNMAPEAIDYMYETYYKKGRNPRASDCRDLLEIVQSICRFKRQPVKLTVPVLSEAAKTFICEF
jgi:predicted ATPase with chaperone activity